MISTSRERADARRRTALLTLCAFLAFAAAPLAAQTVVNGSFEDPNVPNGSFQSNTDFPGWTFTAVGGFLDDGIVDPSSSFDSFIKPLPDGAQALKIQEATLEQCVGTVVAGTCTLSASVYAININNSTDSIKLKAGDTELLCLDPQWSGEWVELEGTVTIPLGSPLIGETLKIVIDQWATPNDQFTYYDDVNLVCEPVDPGPEGCIPTFAIEVIDFNLGWDPSVSGDETAVLGDTPNTRFSVGRDGNITVGFGGPFTTDGGTGTDLCIEEYNVVDCYYVCVKPADAATETALIAAGLGVANGFYEIGLFCSDVEVDIDAAVPGAAAGSLLFSELMLVDDDSAGDGAEFERIQAKFVCPPSDPIDPNDYEYPDRVCNFGAGNSSTSSDGSAATGGPDDSKVDLGDGGCVSVCRSCVNYTTDGADGADLAVFADGDYVLEVMAANFATQTAMIDAGLVDADSNGYYELGNFSGGVEVDVDALVPGFAAGELLFAQAKVSDVAGDGDVAMVDAVGFGSGLVDLPTTQDSSALGNGDFVRLARSFTPGFGEGAVVGNSTNLALGAPDGDALVLGEGGRVQLTFLGAWFSNTGDARPDIFVFEKGQDEGYFLELCPADAFTTQALLDAGYTDVDGDGCYLVLDTACPGDQAIDIDALVPGYAACELNFTDLAIIDDSAAPNTAPESGADIDAVAMTVKAFPGSVSDESFSFDFGINGSAKGHCPPNARASAGDLLEIEVCSPDGTLSNLPFLMAIMCVPANQPITPPTFLDGVWLNPDRAPIILISDDPFAFAMQTCIPITIPAGLEGFCCTFQAFGLSTSAANGVFETTNAFEICLE